MKTRRAGWSRSLGLVSIVLLSLVSSLGMGYPTVVQAVPNAATCAQGNPAGAGAVRLAALTPSHAAAPGDGCPAGLIAYWKLDETSGPPFVDSIGGHDATCTTDCPVSTTGIVNHALKFNSTTTATVQANVAFDFGVGDSFSVEAWISMTAATTCSPAEPAIGRAAAGVPSNHMQWWLGCEDSKAEFVLKDKQGQIAAPFGTTIVTDGHFHNLVGVRDAALNQERLYVDGALEDTQVITYSNGFDSPAPVDLGWYKSINTYHFLGDVDEVAIYNRVLTTDEIALHHTHGLAGHGLCDTSLPPLPNKLYLPLLMR